MGAPLRSRRVAADTAMVEGNVAAEEAFRLLGLGPDADGRAVESAYWRRARELARQRGQDPTAAEELERVNWAYQTLSLILRTRPRPQAKGAVRKQVVKRFLLAGALAVLMFGGMIVGLGFRDQVADGAVQGYERGQDGWNDTIEWLQNLGATPTPNAPGKAQQPKPPQ